MKSLDKKSRKDLIEVLKNNYKIECEKLKNENVFLDEENNIYIYNNIPIAFIKDKKIYPTIFLINECETNMNYIKVNIGAKEKILNGADVFRPGIIEFSDFKKDEIILIISEDNKLLAIGRVLYDINDAIKMEKGKIVENIHYYGDSITKCYLNKIKN